MSLVSNILSGRINLKRFSSTVVGPQVVSPTSIILGPISLPGTSRLEVTLSGATIMSNPGITVEGNTLETISIPQNGTFIGTKNFTSISQIAISGITDGYITIRALNNMGQPINNENLVASNVHVRFFEQGGRIKIDKTGEPEIARIMIMLEPDQDVKNLDNMYVISGIKGITMGQLDFVEAIYDFDGITHHIEAVVKEP